MAPNRVMPDRAALEPRVLSNLEEVARAGAEWLVAAITACDGRAAISLAGGSTPRRLYELLAAPPYQDLLPWPRIHWFWGDERFVPPGDPRSNYRMVRETLLQHAPVPIENIHPIVTEGLTPMQSAGAYERVLQEFYGSATLDPARPLFAAVLLGLGSDGHTASLFPGSAGLKERRRWVLPVTGPDGDPRISLTFPCLESSRTTAFLVVGAEKRAALQRVLQGDGPLPAARLRPRGGRVIIADREAAPAG